MDSLTRQPVTMTSTNSPVPQSAPIIAPTLPVTSKVQFADSLINNKPASVPTIPSTSTVTATTNEPAVANANANAVNSALKSTSNFASTVNPQQAPAVNFSLNSSTNSPQTSTAATVNPSPVSALVNNPPLISSVANPPSVSATFNPPPISAVVNPPPVSASVNSSQTTSVGNNNSSTTTLPNTITNPPTPSVISTASINVKPTSTITTAAPNTIAANPVPEKASIVNKSEPDLKEMNSASSTGSGKSGSISSNSNVPKETRNTTDSSNMNGSMDKGNSQDRAAAAAKKYVPPDTVGKDVQAFCEKIEKAGLCAPANTADSFPGNIASVLSTPPAARPNTAESVVENSVPYKTSPSPGKQATAAKAGIGGGTSAGSAKAPATTATAREPRPSTATPKASSGSGAPKTGSGTTPVASRNSTARAASAKVSPTSPTSKNISNGKSSTPAAATNGNGHHDDKSRAKSAPKLRPTSSLYRPTASSALKGVATITPPKSSKSLSGPNNNITSNKPKMGDAAGNGGSGESKPATLKEQFAVYSRFGDTSSDGKHITLTNCDKWMKQAHVIDGKKITTTDTSISFKKLFKTAKKVGFEDFKKYVDDLAASKKIEPSEITDKLIKCGAPGLSSATRASGGGVYERLTDTSRYTGSSKERFDSTGKGRGIEGRRDIQDDSGYTASFKNKLADGSSPAK